MAAVTADDLTARDVLEGIIAADAPCRTAFHKFAELRSSGDSALLAEVGREGSPVCRASFEQLDEIRIFIPRYDRTRQREKKNAVEYCAEQMRARADLLAHFASPPADEARERELHAELQRVSSRCLWAFERLAQV